MYQSSNQSINQSINQSRFVATFFPYNTDTHTHAHTYTLESNENQSSNKQSPDTRPLVAHSWAGAVMLKNRYQKKNRLRTDRPTDGPTDQGTHPFIELLCATKKDIFAVFWGFNEVAPVSRVIGISLQFFYRDLLSIQSNGKSISIKFGVNLL